MLNSFYMVGMVITEPVKSLTRTNEQCATFGLANRNCAIYCKAYGKLALSAAITFKKSNILAIKGRIRCKKGLNPEFIAEEVYKIGRQEPLRYEGLDKIKELYDPDVLEAKALKEERTQKKKKS